MGMHVFPDDQAGIFIAEARRIGFLYKGMKTPRDGGV
jgi:hypothetical protein